MAQPAGSRVVEAMPAAPPRRRVRSLLSAGHVLMIVAGLVGLLLTLALLRNADRRVEVAVAARDLRTGEPIDTDAIRYERVKMDDDLLATALRGDDVEGLDGAIATGPIGEGELISEGDVRAPATPSAMRAVSVPVDPARAVNGELDVGDRVDVILVTEVEVAVVVANAEVLDVNRPSAGGALGDVDDQFTVTLAVDTRGAQLLAAAVTDGDFLIARSTGADVAEGTPPLPVDELGASPAGSTG